MIIERFRFSETLSPVFKGWVCEIQKRKEKNVRLTKLLRELRDRHKVLVYVSFPSP